MKVNELLGNFTIFTTLEEEAMLKKLQRPVFLKDFEERDQFIIEGMIRKSLVIKIGDYNPRVVANNEF
jgi:hypothetical protein